jgi:hypothetical protein
MRLQQTAERLSNHVFVGGLVGDFERGGRLQLIMLLREGLYPDSKVLDFGCGCLRGGYWLIHFLDPGCYCGIEPDTTCLDAGIKEILEPGLLDTKRPRFDRNPGFDSSVFGEKFDFFLARSIWTHAPKAHIRRMLDSFGRDSTENGVFLSSFYPARGFIFRDYRGTKWVAPGMICHSFSWIQKECAQRGLKVAKLKGGSLNWQVWLRIVKA